MSMIKSRLIKLEELSRDRNGTLRVPGVSPEDMAEIRRVAATCANVNELTAYLHSRQSIDDGGVVSLDERRRDAAVLAATARVIFDDVISS